MDRDVLHKEIDLIQECIKRMAHNSFLLKGWAVSLIAVVLALGKEFNYRYVALLLLMPTLCFWYLDGSFSRIERMYRKMYEWVIRNRAQTEDHLYELDPYRFESAVPNWLRMMLCRNLFLFYGISVVTLIVVFIVGSV